MGIPHWPYDVRNEEVEPRRREDQVEIIAIIVVVAIIEKLMVDDVLPRPFEL